MGCDGGSIPHRAEMVKTKKKAEVPNSESQRQATWFTCALSKLPLVQPLVSCPLGKLYNRQAILEYLTKTGTFGDAETVCGHIDNIKLVTTLNLTPNPAASASDGASMVVANHTNETNKASLFICPISMKEMNGITKFCYISTCGCVFAEQSLKEVGSGTCLKCGAKFDKQDTIPLYPCDSTEIKRMNERMEHIKAELAIVEATKKAEKKAKKIKKLQESSEDGTNIDVIKLKKRKKSSDQQVPVQKVVVVAAAEPKYQSEAIKSLYTKKNANGITNPLFSGTFNRYAAYN